MRKAVLITVFTFLVQSLFGQDSLTYQDVKELIRIYHAPEISLGVFGKTPHEIFEETPETKDYMREVLSAEAEYVSSDLGLSFRAIAQENLRGGIEENEQNLTRTRLSAGLDWDLLSDGYRDNRIKARVIENEMKLLTMNKRQSDLELNYYKLYNLIIYLHNSEKIKLLKRRIQFLESVFELFTDLNSSHHIDRGTLMKVEGKLQHSQRVLKSYISYNQGTNEELFPSDSIQTTDVKYWPILQIELETLLAMTNKESLNEEVLRMELENLQLRKKAQKDLRFKLFARYTHNRIPLENANRSYPTIGAALEVPIRMSTGQLSRLYRSKSEQLESSFAFEINNTRKELMNHYYEYQYHLKQHYQVENQKVELEYKIKLDSTALRYNVYLDSPLGLIGHVLHQSDAELELIDIKQQLYLKLLKIYTMSGSLSLDDFTVVAESDETEPVKWLLLESTPESSKFLQAYVSMNNFDRILVHESVPIPSVLTDISDHIDESALMDLKIERGHLSVSDFTSKADLERSIRELVRAGESKIIISNWSDLLALELGALKD